MNRLIQLRAYALQDPDNERIVLDIIDELLDKGLISEARSVLNDIRESWRTHPDFLWRTGRCALCGGQFAEAIEALQSLLAAGSDAAAVRHDLAFALLCDRQLDAAEQVLAPVLAQAIALPSIGILHARLLQHRRQLDDAVLIVEAIVHDHPEHAEAWGLLALLHVDLVHPEAARKAAETSLRLMPHQPDALTALGTLALWSRDSRASYQAFADVLVFQPDAGRALAGAGESLMLTGDIAAARAFLSRAVARMPNHIGTWHALEIDRNFGETHGGFALIHALNGQMDEARQAIKRALRLDSDSRNARYAQSLLWTAEGRTREAAAMVDGILAEAGLNPAQRPVGFIEQLQARIKPAGCV
ncbi:tetratricopeptide repeat protein [Dyella silvatica]|uniref:tetratricopeptide repeat protein n=1 Tax=Dyella silvatica TaxID=2992128 RepID=UPI002252916F|nr:tetratricopeptide repeat protein [Dyella silvatica]